LRILLGASALLPGQGGPPPRANTAHAQPTAPAAAPAPVPADLQALEAKMLALHPNSVQFSLTLSASASGAAAEGPFGSFKGIFGQASAAAAPLLEAYGEVMKAPEQASLRASVVGLVVQERLVGGTEYTKEPFLAKLDGGRPWVEKRHQTLKSTFSEGSVPAAGEDPTSFAGTPKLIARARVIREQAPALVDGQTTSAFTLSIDLIRGRKLSARARRALLKHFDRLATLELFIAPNGVPVRTTLRVRVRSSHRRAQLIVQVDVPAIEVAFTVSPPPAAETISEAALNRLMASQRHRHRRRSKSK
jgi:hypothetical protein